MRTVPRMREAMFMGILMLSRYWLILQLVVGNLDSQEVQRCLPDKRDYLFGMVIRLRVFFVGGSKLRVVVSEQ